MAISDDHAISRVLKYLALHGCPTPQKGEGSALFPPSDGLLTPDIVAGTFFGPTHPSTFFIDVVTPSGDYVFKPLARAPQAAAFFSKKVEERGEWTMGMIPSDLAQPLVSTIRKKADKYSRRRSNSVAFGVAAYFNETSTAGGHVMTMVTYLKALNDTLGPVPEAALPLLLDAKQTMIVCPVAWDEPMGFVLQYVDGHAPRGVLMVNTHPRVKDGREHDVMRWASGLGA